MPDKIALQIGGKRIENFVSYSVESDIYTADDAFSLELSNPEINVKAGQRCELYVNDKLELTGLIDRVERSGDKSSARLSVSGRDLMGLLVDSCCEEGLTLEGMTVKALAERLLRTVPYINRKSIVYQGNLAGGTTGGSTAALLDAPHKFTQIEPGQTIFEALKQYAASRGMMFFCLPDGTMVFGRPKAKGKALYSVSCQRDGRTNIIEGTKIEDFSRRYSKFIVIGQQQGTDDITADKINTGGVPVLDSDVPYYKPLVIVDNNDGQSPALHANMVMGKARFDGFQLVYKVPGHRQGNRNWTINELCAVDDEVRSVHGTYLIYGRTFSLSKDEGTITELKLSIPGVAQ